MQNKKVQPVDEEWIASKQKSKIDDSEKQLSLFSNLDKVRIRLLAVSEMRQQDFLCLINEEDIQEICDTRRFPDFYSSGMTLNMMRELFNGIGVSYKHTPIDWKKHSSITSSWDLKGDIQEVVENIIYEPSFSGSYIVLLVHDCDKKKKIGNMVKFMSSIDAPVILVDSN